MSWPMARLEFGADASDFPRLAGWSSKLLTVGNADPTSEDEIRALVEHDNGEVEHAVEPFR